MPKSKFTIKQPLLSCCQGDFISDMKVPWTPTVLPCEHVQIYPSLNGFSWSPSWMQKLGSTASKPLEGPDGVGYLQHASCTIFSAQTIEASATLREEEVGCTCDFLYNSPMVSALTQGWGGIDYRSPQPEGLKPIAPTSLESAATTKTLYIKCEEAPLLLLLSLF